MAILDVAAVWIITADSATQGIRVVAAKPSQMAALLGDVRLYASDFTLLNVASAVDLLQCFSPRYAS